MKRFAAAVLTVLCSVAFVPAYVPLPAASASDTGGGSVSVPVELTSAQTLALYGQNINAMYFNGVSTSYVSFDYWKSSKEIVAAVEDRYRENNSNYPFISGFAHQNIFGLSSLYWNNASQGQSYPDWFSSSNGSVSSKTDFSVFEFLIYRWQGSPNTVSERVNDFQFYFDQSISLEGVDRFRSFYGFSIGTVNSLQSRVNVSYSNLHSQTNLYVSTNSTTPLYTGTETRISGAAYFGDAYLPVYFNSELAPYNPTFEILQDWLTPAPHMALCPIDTGALESSVTISRSVLNARAAQGVICNAGSPQVPDYTEPYVYLIIACPIVWGNITPPEPPAPDINDQLDGIGTGINEINNSIGNVNVNLSGTNHRLDLILQKLDQIYQEMVDDNGGVELVPPDSIGLSPTAKQRVLDGLSGLDDTMGNVDSGEFNTSAVQGIGSFWGRVKSVLPSGLWSVYMLCLVGGIVSWIIYGKRGG